MKAETDSARYFQYLNTLCILNGPTFYVEFQVFDVGISLDKNDPSRFLGEGITFKAKLIGILEVSEARGDKMCQDALNDLKTAIRAAGEHKQRITISISIDGLRLRDEKTGDCLYHHPVHKISFIAQDMSDSRAFGYIFGSPDTGHRFFGIKTDKTASQVVISMRDLFQVVFELKKKEIEMAKHHSEQHHMKYGSTGYMDSIHFSKDESELDKGKGKYSQILKSRCLTTKSVESGSSDLKGTTSEAIADLLDLEHELNSIQQGINQMDKITPSDPFGPLSKGESYIDPFDDSFSSKVERPPEEKPAPDKSLKMALPQEDPQEVEKHSSFFGSTTSTSKTFFSQFSPGIGKSKADDSKWFDQETESLFSETVNVNNSEPTSSPIALNTPAPEPEQAEEKRSPIKTDLFTELDPLGTGRVKPYVDKKDFFQELKNPPKKVLKEMITDVTATESSSSSSFYFQTQFKERQDSPTTRTESGPSSNVLEIQGFKDGSSRYAKADPFEDGDPFEKTDPFQEESFPSSIGFPPLFGNKASIDEIFEEKVSWKFDKPIAKKEDNGGKNSPTNMSLFSSGTLRVSLPPEKIETTPLSLSTITSKLKSSPSSPDEGKSLRRKCYQALKQSTIEGSEESPIQEEPFVSKMAYGTKPETERRSPFKEKFYSVQSPPGRNPEKTKTSSSVEILDATTPDPPPRSKAALFSIKPPPLPPKKLSQPNFRPPARPPSLEDNTSHYDYLKQKEANDVKEELKCVKLKKQPFGSPCTDLKKQNSEKNFPVLPPPPHRKASTDGKPTGRKPDKKTQGSILNIKLTQLDSTGLENLATTLGIPPENIYSMTLQELTKMLAEKYLSQEAKPEVGESFEVDFDANFGKTETNPPPSYDKYAVFKELIESQPAEENSEPRKEEETEKETEKQEEDKYAALRQLSLNAQNEEEQKEVEEVAEVVEETTKWEPEPKAEVEVDKWVQPEPEATTDSQLFPLMDQFSEDKKTPPQRDNWATFEKSDFGETVNKFNENENSPFSSDGKEEVREIPFHWHQNAFRKKTRKDVPWQDDDESWDDYSPKESFCSDESSHEERSPEVGIERYEKPSWSNVRPPKSDRFWDEKTGQCNRRWHEETEDEFEESWRKQRERTGSYDSERKNFWHLNNYDSYGKRYEWNNSRSEPWDENERHHCYGTRRKRSESDNEYRKRCDSDTSDKECVWTFQKSYQESHGRTGKQKPYHGGSHTFRDCSEYCHEPRKHRKGVTQKRPNSASDAKRNYEKYGEYRTEKPYPGKRDLDKEDFSRYHKESRYRDPDFYYSYDRKHHPKGRRCQGDAFPSPSKRDADAKNEFGYFEPFSEKPCRKTERHFQFENEGENFEKGKPETPQEFQKSPERRANQWASTNGKTGGETFFAAKNNNDFAAFSSPKKTKENGKEGETVRMLPKSKAHVTMLSRQESSTTLRKSDSINIFSRDKDPFEGDDFFSSVS